MTETDTMTASHPPSLEQVVSDLGTEGEELYRLLRDADTGIWTQHSAFKNWTVWDVIAHLHFSDHMALTSVTNSDEFQILLSDLKNAKAVRGYTDQWLRVDVHPPTGPQLLERWHDKTIELCSALVKADPNQRFAWVGPGMKARMLTTARQMETWAHGWEVYDLMGITRSHTGRLKNIATIGVKTFAWTFTNRKLPVPETQPHVSLTAPNGERWQWNPTDSAHRIVGEAVEFCQVVTQVRNIADTQLIVEGDNANAWMQIAQCFAGPAQEPPAPGSRTQKYLKEHK